MIVSDLLTEYGTSRGTSHQAYLKDVKLTEEGLELPRATVEFDDVALSHLSTFLSINGRYLAKCPPELQRENINYWLEHHGDTEARFEILSNTVRGVFNPNQKIFPVEKILEVMGRVFRPHDEVKAFNVAEDLIHLDIISLETKVEVPGLGTAERPHVGDITYGGIRSLTYPQQEKAPEIESYFNRIWCTNGMSAPRTEHRVSLKGNTVDDVLLELERKAQDLMNELPIQLEEYRRTAEIPSPSKLGQFVYQLGREYELPGRVMDTVMSRLAELPTEPSVYDVTQAITSIANEDITWKNRLRLQRLGGALSTDTAATLHRCDQCERPI